MNAALAIYRTPNSAYSVVQASPIHFQLQQGKDGWVSKISRDASAEGAVSGLSKNEPRVNDTSDEGSQDTPSHDDANHNGLQDELPETDLPYQPNYSQDDSIGATPDAHIGSGDRWESKLFTQAVQRESNHPDATRNTSFGTFSPNIEPPQTSNNDKIEKPSRKSARQLAEHLLADIKSAGPSPEAGKNQHTPPPIREFQLTVVKSLFDHQAYIERQAYYAGFNPEMKTIMAEDLKDRVPVEGFLDCSLNKRDVPLRIRLKRKEQNRSPISLRELWETGKRERGEI
ncbi:MAG: hypothetical protein Q9186_003476 [Xanthomendoza sp. 1 TL-2023]